MNSNPGSASRLSEVGDVTTGTFLFCDVANSTELWERDEVAMAIAIARLEQQLRTIVDRCGGVLAKFLGDGCLAAFEGSASAFAGALAIQREITDAGAEVEPLRLRVGLHSGEAQERDGDFYGPAVNLAARIMDAAHGGQIALSERTASELAGVDGLRVIDMGEYPLKGFAHPQRVLLARHPELSDDRNEVRIAGQVTDTVPVPPNRMIGRETEVSAVMDSIDRSRMTVVLGPGGVGKTRLATEVAHRLRERFVNGVWFADLALSASAATALAAMATDLGLQTTTPEHQALAIAEFFGDREMLIILDNCEHVVEPIEALCGELVARCPAIKILATSRVPLPVASARPFHLRPLAVSLDPTNQQTLGRSPAEELLLERAADVRPTADLSAADLAVIRQICVNLDGAPLAIELAAGWLRSLSLVEVLTRLTNQLDFLRSRGEHEGRQQTMRATVKWSFDLLPPAEQDLFARLCVFGGGFTIHAAHSIGLETAGDELDTIERLDSLVSKSMVTLDDRGRYRINETLRQFGHEVLRDRGEFDDATARFVEYYLDLDQDRGSADGARPLLDEVDHYQRLMAEFDNLRLVREHLHRAGDPARLFRFLRPLHDFGLWQMKYEVGSWCVDAIELEGAEHDPGFADLAGMAAYLRWSEMRADQAEVFLATGFDAERRHQHRPSMRLRDAAASLALFGRDFGQARALAAEWEELAIASHDARARGRAAFTQCIAALGLGDVSSASTKADLLGQIADESDLFTVRSWHQHVGGLLLRGSDPERAIELFLASAETARQAGLTLQTGVAWREAAPLLAERGELARSFTLYRDLTRLWLNADDWANQLQTMLGLARLLADNGHDRAATAAVRLVERSPLAAMRQGALARLNDRIGSTAAAGLVPVAANPTELLVIVRDALDELCYRTQSMSTSYLPLKK